MSGCGGVLLGVWVGEKRGVWGHVRSCLGVLYRDRTVREMVGVPADLGGRGDKCG